MDDFARVLTALNDGGVEYVVVGGIAVVAHGYLRATRDIDVVIAGDEANVARTRAVCRGLDATRQDGSPLQEADLEPNRAWILRTSLAYLDILPDREIAFGALRTDAAVRRVDGVPVPICSLAHLIVLKRAAGRTKDRLDLEMLEAALGELPG